MPQIKFPEKITSATTAWLTSVLRVKGVLDSGTVTDFNSSRIIGGYTSLVYRLELEYDKIEPAAP